MDENDPHPRWFVSPTAAAAAAGRRCDGTVELGVATWMTLPHPLSS